MSWGNSMLIAGALVALARGHHTMMEGNDLSKTGYHLCTVNETKIESRWVFSAVSYIVQRHCGGWLLWRMCNVTLYKMTPSTEYKEVTLEVTRCCHGYVRVGRYCVLPLNRSREFTTKPGFCPTAAEEPPDGCQTCVWDIDCPVWQKCCQMLNRFRCVNPATFSHYAANGGWSLNVTVTVKTDYHGMMALDKGLLNHAQLLHAMVSGALNSDVSVQYLSSCPVDPYRTATSLIIGCNATLSIDDTMAIMHRLLRDIAEVSSVTVEDVDECAHTALRNCSPHAECNNTVSSYNCTCRHGYTDVLPQSAGASCEVDRTPTDATTCIYGQTGPPSPPATPGPTLDGPAENHTLVVVSSPDPSQPTATLVQSTTSETVSPSDSAPTTLQTSAATDTSATLHEERPTCAPPQLTQLSPSHITGTSFYLSWSGPTQSNQTSYLVDLRKGSEIISHNETNETTLKVTGLDPGVLYSVSVIPCACGAEGESHRLNVTTVAETLKATARVTNMNFTEDLLNSSSQAYFNFSMSIKEEIYKSLSPELSKLVDSGKVRIEITSLSPGSVVVNFIIVYDVSYTMLNVSSAVLSSLFNSTKYIVDENSTSVSDFDECASGRNDCPQNATCNNTLGSYTCVCNDGFQDMDSDWPGRVCGDTTTTSLTTSTTVDNATPSLAPPTTVPTTTPSLATPTTVPTTTPSLAPPTTVPTTTPSLAPPTTVPTTTPSLATPTTVPTTTPSLAPPTTVPTTTPSLAPPTTVPTTTPSLAPPTTVPTTTPSLAPPTTVPTTTPSLTTTTTVSTTTPSLAPPTTVPTTTPSLAPPTTVPTTTPSLTTTTTVSTTTPSLAPPTNVPTTTPSLAPPTTVPTTTPSLTTPTTVLTATTSLAPPTTVPSATTSLAPPTTVPTTTPSLAPPTTVPSATTSLAPPTTVPTATTSLATSPTVPIVHMHNEIPLFSKVLPPISVECSLKAIMVTVPQDFLRTNQISELSLHLGKASNRPLKLNNTHVRLTAAWEDTTLLSNNSYLTAKVNLSNSPQPLTNGTARITNKLHVPISCTYRKSVFISADFGDMGYNMNIDPISASGSFEVIMQLLNGMSPLPHNYTLSPNEDVVVKVSINTSAEEMKLVISKCWATPTLNREDSPSYIFLNSGCPLPDSYTAIISNGNSSSSSLSVRIFSFVELDVVYLHCLVQICMEMGLATCVPDCSERKARLANTVGSAVGSSGALLRQNDEGLVEALDMLHLVGFSFLGIGMSLILLACLTCLVFYQRNRIGHYNFNTKPKQDNFTFHAFNA